MLYDVIIVLGNEMDQNGILNDESKARVKLAVSHQRDWPHLKLITCGWCYRSDSDLYIGDMMKMYALELGAQPESILVEPNSRDTVGDAYFTKSNIVQHHTWKNLLIVTSTYHVDRTRKIFEFIYGPAYNIQVVGSEPSSSPNTNISEGKSIQAFQKTFLGVTPGNDEKILQKLRDNHPFYNGTIYPRI